MAKYEYEIITLGELGVNCVVLWCKDTKEGVVIDPGDEFDRIDNMIYSKQIKLKYILLTHAHYDHIGAVDKIRTNYNVELYAHKNAEEYLVDPQKNHSAYHDKEIIVENGMFLEDNAELRVGNLIIKLIHTPGHTKDCSCYFIDDIQPLLISGDTLFKGTIGRTDLYGGDYKTIIKSIKTRLLVLPDETVVIPGHGRMTKISDEKIYF